MEAGKLEDILSGGGISIDPGTILRVREGLWRARGSSGELALRFVPGEAVSALWAFSAMEQVRPGPSVSLQKMLDFIRCDGGAVAVLQWVQGSTLRESFRDEMPRFFDGLARWHMINACGHPLYSGYTDGEYRSIAGLIDGELDLHLGLPGLGELRESCRDELEPLTSGFVTYTHGDVHPGNILRRPDGGFTLLDPEYLHVGCNYLDLDYLDWWGVEPDPVPWWIIRDQAGASVKAYFSALGVAAGRIPAIMKAVALLAALRSHTNCFRLGTGDSGRAMARVRLILDGGLPAAPREPCRSGSLR